MLPKAPEPKPGDPVDPSFLSERISIALLTSSSLPLPAAVVVVHLLVSVLHLAIPASHYTALVTSPAGQPRLFAANDAQQHPRDQSIRNNKISVAVMGSRRYVDDVSIDRYEDRRDYSSRGGRRVYDDRFTEEEVDFRRGTPVRERERERERDVREVLVRDDVRERPGNTPAFLREDYGRTTAGPVVLRAREREEFDFIPTRPRRRSPSPEPERKVEKDQIFSPTFEFSYEFKC